MLQEDIKDEDYLFGESQLSRREKQEREYKKKVLSYALEHKKAGDIEKVQRYRMPKEKQEPSQYDEIIDEEKGPNYEQKKWEEDKLGYAQMRFGAKDAKQRNKVGIPYYVRQSMWSEVDLGDVWCSHSPLLGGILFC